MACQPNPGRGALAAAKYLDASGAWGPDGTIRTEETEEDDEMPVMPLPEAEDAAEAAEDARLYARLDPSKPIPALPGGDGITFGSPDLPDAPSNDAANRAFDDLLRRMVLIEGKTEVTVAEFVARFPYRSRNTIARRLTAMCDPENPHVVFPPGIALERTPTATKFLAHVLAPAGAGGGGNGG
jgi:hypothetical protein